MLLVMRKVIS